MTARNMEIVISFGMDHLNNASNGKPQNIPS